MTALLILIGVMVIPEVLSFILEIADMIFERKKLQLENEILKNEIKKANETIMNNLGEFARTAKSKNNTENNKDVENLKNRNAELLIENMRLKSLIGAYQNVYGNGFNSKQGMPQGTIEAVKYAMKHAHPDNGGNSEDFIKFKKAYEELTNK